MRDVVMSLTRWGDKLWSAGWLLVVCVVVAWWVRYGPLARGAEYQVESRIVGYAVESRVPPLPTDPSVPAPPGYQWVKRGTGPWRLERSAQEVPARGPFRADPFHTCAKCGTEQRTVAGFNADGTHTHICPKCGNAWRH